MLVILRSRVLRVLCCLISITKKVSFEIEYFVGTHSRKLRVILRTRVPRVVCDLIIVTKMSAVRSRISSQLIFVSTSNARTTCFMCPHHNYRNEIDDFVDTHSSCVGYFDHAYYGFYVTSSKMLCEIYTVVGNIG